MTARPRLLPLATLLALAVGCGPAPTVEPPRPVVLPEVRAYHGDSLRRAGRLRTLVLPFRHNDRSASEAVTQAFALELAKAQHVEVLADDSRAAELGQRLGVWDGQCLDIHALTVLRRRLGVGAVACGSILRYRPYGPPILGLRVQLVSTRTGGVLWGAEGTFDASNAGTQYLMRRFYELWMEDTPRSLGWRVLLHSPRQFNQFVVHQLVESIEPTEIPAVASTSH
ncbi:MAG: hypothetical protein ACODAJ_05545 [Planctomycetota bacterium]